MGEEFLKEDTRAEDILLGSLGFAEDAVIIELHSTPEGYRGKAKFIDGELVEFESEDELDDLQRWALDILLKKFG